MQQIPIDIKQGYNRFLQDKKILSYAHNYYLNWLQDYLYFIYMQNILSWLVGFTVKILSKLAKTHTDVLPAPTWQKASG